MSSSCSWGANRLGRNGMRRRVHRGGLDETADGNEACRTAERRKRPCVRPATFETGSCSSEGSGVPQNGGNRPPTVEKGPVDREGCGVPQNRGNGLVLECYGRNGGPVHREGRGVPQNEGNEIVLECYGQNDGPVHRRGVAYRKTGLHGLLFTHR